MKITIPKLRRVIQKVISESMADTARQLQDIGDISRGPIGSSAMDNLSKREKEIKDQENKRYYEKLAAEEAAAEKYFVRLSLPSRFNQHYAEWKSWLDSLDLSGAEFIDKQYHDDERKQKPSYFLFKVGKQKALEIEAEGNTLPETDYSLVSATVHRV